MKFQPGEAQGRLQQFNAVSGSYTDQFATPKILDAAFSVCNGAVKKLQKAFFEVETLRQHDFWGMRNPDVFARPNHIAFHVRSVLNSIFFHGFENESFNTSSGISRFLDPDLRQAKFYEYYDQQDAREDPQFEEFHKTKVLDLLDEFREHRMNVRYLEQVGGTQLASSFRAAARRVWMLHKLAFSFEPPASIFRVEKGAELDPNYMKPHDDDEKFVARVAFMITPGLRLRKSVIPCEVYLSRESV